MAGGIEGAPCTAGERQPSPAQHPAAAPHTPGLGGLHRVALASDGSSSALRAAAWLGRLRAAGARMDILVVYVVPAPGQVYALGLSDGPIPAGPAGRRFRRQADEAIERTLAALGAQRQEVRTAAEIGEPARVVHRLARDGGCDAIVVGRRGLTPARAALLGSVSTAMLTHAPCPVIVVP